MTKALATILDGLEICETCGELQVSVSGLSYDSRKIQPGDVFITLRGVHVDGSTFVEDAIGRGARVIVTENPLNGSLTVSGLRVPDSRRALARLARNFYENPSRDLRLIGVTGTNGKTTTTLLIESILQHAGKAAGLIGTLGYHWGQTRQPASMTTPESSDLQRLFWEMKEGGITHVVMEVSSHALSLGRVEGCEFDAGVFTNLSQDHLDFHATMAEYFDAKRLLFADEVSIRAEGFSSVINVDDPYGKRLSQEISGNLWTYSVGNREARVWVKEADLEPSGIEATFATPLGDLRVSSPLLGRLNLYNLLASATTALAMGIPGEAISEGLHVLASVDGRLQRVPIPRACGFEVVVDYAHTPDAMEKALSCLREMTRGRLLVVFGCGGDRDRSKRPLMGRVGAQFGDLVILTSDNPRSEKPEEILREIEPGVQAAGLAYHASHAQAPEEKAYAIEGDRRRAIGLALAWAAPGDIVFIGGKGHETYQIVGTQVLPFDDRAVVQEWVTSLAGVSQPQDTDR